MKNLKTIYAYRYNENENLWEKTRIDRVFVSGTREAFALGDTLNRCARVTLRVMSDGDINISPEDLISFSDGEKPGETSLVVVSVTKNENGSRGVRHTKILCS